MADYKSDVSAPRNRLLAALPPAELAKLWPRLEAIDQPLRQIIMRPDEPITDVHFPETGWVSMVATMADGNSAEVGMVGTEGMTGLPLLLGATASFVEGMVQGPGVMFRLGAADFREALDGSQALAALLLRYSLAFQEQVTQTAACNGHHGLDQRLARWLLMAHDRARTDTFPMTQEFLALMLCVHRPGVTVAARLFQQAGLIRYGQGQLTVTDRAGLEAVACECYDTVRQRFITLLGVHTS